MVGALHRKKWMPTMGGVTNMLAAKYCMNFPCPNLATEGGHCPKHARPRAAKQTDPFYLSPRWRRFRAWYLAGHPMCIQCEREGRLVPADMVDHVVELRDGGDPLSEDNVQALCRKCHAVKTAEVKDKRKNHQKSGECNRIGSRKET